jgi:hypothetical protein
MNARGAARVGASIRPTDVLQRVGVVETPPPCQPAPEARRPQLASPARRDLPGWMGHSARCGGENVGPRRGRQFETLELANDLYKSDASMQLRARMDMLPAQ